MEIEKLQEIIDKSNNIFFCCIMVLGDKYGNRKVTRDYR